MQTSEKQINANRRNAQKSTGPNTDEGKEIAARNSIKHGFYSKDVVIDSPNLKENQSDYDLLLESLIGELKPTTLFQHQLVEKIANCLWRSRRAIRAESANINNQLRDIDYNVKKAREIDIFRHGKDDSPEIEWQKEDQIRNNIIGIGSIPDENISMRLLRYEMRLDRQMTRAYKLLKFLQLQNEADSLQS